MSYGLGGSSSGENGFRNYTFTASNETGFNLNLNPPIEPSFFGGGHFPGDNGDDGPVYPFTSFWDLWPRRTITPEHAQKLMSDLKKIFKVVAQTIFPLYSVLFSSSNNLSPSSKFSIEPHTTLTKDDILINTLWNITHQATVIVAPAFQATARMSDEDYEKQFPIHHFIKNSNYDALQVKEVQDIPGLENEKLLEQLNQPDHEGQTPLTLALRVESSTFVQKLIEMGAEVNPTNPKAHVPLVELLSGYKSTPRTELMMDCLLKNKADPSLKDPIYHRSPLGVCVDGGKSQSFEKMEGAIEKLSFSEQQDLLMRTLYYQGINNLSFDSALSMARTLLSNKVDPNFVGSGGVTPLYYAVDRISNDPKKKEMNKFVNLLLEHGANPNYVPEGESTPQNVPLIRLIENVSSEDENQLELNWRVIQLLLKKGASLTTVNARGESPIQMAAKKGNLKLLEYAFNSKVPLDVENGISPIITAAQMGQFEVLKFFVTLNVNPRQRDPQSGFTAFDYVVKGSREDKLASDLLRDLANPEGLHGASAACRGLEYLKRFVDYLFKRTDADKNASKYEITYHDHHYKSKALKETCKNVIGKAFEFFNENPSSFFDEVLTHVDGFELNKPLRAIDYLLDPAIARYFNAEQAFTLLDHISKQAQEKEEYVALRDQFLDTLASAAYNHQVLAHYPKLWTDPLYENSEGLSLLILTLNHKVGIYHVFHDLPEAQPVAWAEYSMVKENGENLLHRLAQMPSKPSKKGMGTATVVFQVLPTIRGWVKGEKTELLPAQKEGEEPQSVPLDPMGLALKNLEDGATNWEMVGFLIHSGYPVEKMISHIVDRKLFHHMVVDPMDEDLRLSLLSYLEWPVEYLDNEDEQKHTPLDLALLRGDNQVLLKLMQLGAKKINLIKEGTHNPLESLVSYTQEDLTVEQIPQLVVWIKNRVAENPTVGHLDLITSALENDRLMLALAYLLAGMANHRPYKNLGNALHFLFPHLMECKGERGKKILKLFDQEFDLVIHSVKQNASHLLFQKREIDGRTPIDMLFESPLINADDLIKILSGFQDLNTYRDHQGKALDEKLAVKGLSAAQMQELGAMHDLSPERTTYLLQLFCESADFNPEKLATYLQISANPTIENAQGLNAIQILAKRVQEADLFKSIEFSLSSEPLTEQKLSLFVNGLTEAFVQKVTDMHKVDNLSDLYRGQVDNLIFNFIVEKGKAHLLELPGELPLVFSIFSYFEDMMQRSLKDPLGENPLTGLHENIKLAVSEYFSKGDELRKAFYFIHSMYLLGENLLKTASAQAASRLPEVKEDVKAINAQIQGLITLIKPYEQCDFEAKDIASVEIILDNVRKQLDSLLPEDLLALDTQIKQAIESLAKGDLGKNMELLGVDKTHQRWKFLINQKDSKEQSTWAKLYDFERKASQAIEELKQVNEHQEQNSPTVDSELSDDARFMVDTDDDLDSDNFNFSSDEESENS